MEVVVMRGDQVLGARRPKRRRNAVEERPQNGEKVGEEANGGDQTNEGGLREVEHTGEDEREMEEE